jgi:hypothetical protein
VTNRTGRARSRPPIEHRHKGLSHEMQHAAQLQAPVVSVPTVVDQQGQIGRLGQPCGSVPRVLLISASRLPCLRAHVAPLTMSDCHKTHLHPPHSTTCRTTFRATLGIWLWNDRTKFMIPYTMFSEATK